MPQVDVEVHGQVGYRRRSPRHTFAQQAAVDEPSNRCRSPVNLVLVEVIGRIEAMFYKLWSSAIAVLQPRTRARTAGSSSFIKGLPGSSYLCDQDR